MSSNKTLTTKVNLRLLFSVLFALLITISTIILGIDLAFADRSELGFGLQFNLTEQLSKQTFDTNLGYFISQEQQAWSQSEQLLQVGLGLSFSSSIWLKLGLSQSQNLVIPTEESEICVESQFDHSPPDKNTGLSQGRCVRLKGEFPNRAFHSAIAYNYKPFDDLSPFIELSLAINYLPRGDFWTYIERSSHDLTQSQWTDLNLGVKIQRQELITSSNRFAIGFEKRLMSRWGIRLSSYFSYNFSNIDPNKVSLSYGLGLDLIHYQYIRLL